MTLSQIEVFIKVIENRSFTKAGEELHMSQSAVSHSIALMEDELGLPLIIRDKKQGVVVSDFGARVLISARNILKEVSQIKQAAAMEKGLDIGTIRIGSFPSATARLLPKIISRFKKQYSGIDIVLFDGNNQEVSEWLSNGVIDISFTAKLEKSNNIIPLTKDKIFAVLPKNHPLLELQSIPISKFSDIPFIMPKSGCEPLIMEIFNTEGLSPNVSFEVRDTNTLLNMVKEGLGISFVPQLALPDKISEFEIRDLSPNFWRYLGIYCPNINKSTPSVQKFILMSQQLFGMVEG